MKTIYYLGLFDSPEHRRSACSPAAVLVMNYVARAIYHEGYHIVMISGASDFHKKTREEGDLQGIRQIYTPSYGESKSKFIKLINRLKRRINIISELSRLLSPQDTLVVYHGFGLAKHLLKLKKKIGFKLVIHVGEIYSDLDPNGDREKEIELLSKADAYILTNIFLNSLINKNRRPFTIVHGTYESTTSNKVSITNKKDKINVVYAGALYKEKGVLQSIEAAKYLSKNYNLFILGSGSTEDVELVREKIRETQKSSDCRIFFKGLLLGEDYDNFIKSCDIGLCTQDQNAKFNNTSFPSKILSYISNGLRVVCTEVPAIRNSKLEKNLFFSTDQAPQSIAKAIKEIDLSEDYNHKEILNKLHNDFINDLRKIL